MSIESEIYQERRTLTAAATASPTRPGEACHVPKPTDGILAPVLSSKNLIALAIIRGDGVQDRYCSLVQTQTAFLNFLTH